METILTTKKLFSAFLFTTSFLFISSSIASPEVCQLEGSGSFKLQCTNKSLGLEFAASGMDLQSIESVSTTISTSEINEQLGSNQLEQASQTVFSSIRDGVFTMSIERLNYLANIMGIPKTFKVQEVKGPAGSIDYTTQFSARAYFLVSDFEKNDVPLTCTLKERACPKDGN